jgi:hypothetical protein
VAAHQRLHKKAAHLTEIRRVEQRPTQPQTQAVVAVVVDIVQRFKQAAMAALALSSSKCRIRLAQYFQAG